MSYFSEAMTGKRLSRLNLPALRVPRGVLVDSVFWLIILPYHALAGWPSESTAARFFIEIIVLAMLREAAQRIWVKRATSIIELLWGFLFCLTVFSILGVGVRFVGIGIAWLLVAVYAALMLLLNEPQSQDSEQISDPQWDSARHRVGHAHVGLWQNQSPRHLIFSVGGRKPAVVVGQNFFLQDPSVRDFLFFHELGHLSLGHFRRLGYYNIGLYATVIVLSISAAALSDLKYLGPGHWLPLGHCFLCGFFMTWLGWIAQRTESSLRLRLEVEADRFAIDHTGDQEAARRFLAAYADHPLERGDANHDGRIVPATRRLELLGTPAN
jgi:hypothetical protein